MDIFKSVTAKPNETEEELEKRQAKLKEWEEFTEASTKGTQTLLTAVASATTKQTNSDWEDDEFNIMDSGFARGERVIYIPGAVLSRLGAYRPFLTQKRPSERGSHSLFTDTCQELEA